MRIITYDLETLKTIEDAGGWDAHDKLGVSVLCANVWNWPNGWDTYIIFSDELAGLRPMLGDYDVYEVKPLRDFQGWVNDSDLCVGFNNLRFDNRVLAFNGVDVPVERTYDILIEGWKAQNLPLDTYAKGTHSGGLNDYAEANLGESKSGSGELAPRLWAEGKYEAVVSYCLRDVRLTKELFDLICHRGWLDNPAVKRRIDFPRWGEWPPLEGDRLCLATWKGGAK